MLAKKLLGKFSDGEKVISFYLCRALTLYILVLADQSSEHHFFKLAGCSQLTLVLLSVILSE